MNKQNAIPTTRSLPRAIERIAKLESEMNKKFLERDRFSARLIDALIMGQHILAVGPPGTSKSDQCLAVADAIKEFDEEKSRKGIAEHRSIKAWKYQFQPFTTLSEVFGACVRHPFCGECRNRRPHTTLRRNSSRPLQSIQKEPCR